MRTLQIGDIVEIKDNKHINPEYLGRKGFLININNDSEYVLVGLWPILENIIYPKPAILVGCGKTDIKVVK